MNNPALLVQDIHKSFGTYKVLKGVSIQARKGDVVSLIGSSGSGKSTLLRCVNFLETPDSGSVTVDGEAIRITPGERGGVLAKHRGQIERMRTRLGMVFQNFNLWPHRTVLRNITEAPIHVLGIDRAQAVHEAEVLLSKVGLADKRDHYPNQLSGGQQQRVAIARALAMKPSIMLFDEPTSALDPELVQEVLCLMRQLADEGRTMVVVTHEMAFARDVSSHVVFLNQGVIEEQGTPSEVFTKFTSPRLRQFLSH
jgi:octopine/nopaline transport system ATP-binding protein